MDFKQLLHVKVDYFVVEGLIIMPVFDFFANDTTFAVFSARQYIPLEINGDGRVDIVAIFHEVDFFNDSVEVRAEN